MWAARIFSGILIAGIAFLLRFLVALRDDRAFRCLQVTANHLLLHEGNEREKVNMDMQTAA